MVFSFVRVFEEALLVPSSFGALAFYCASRVCNVFTDLAQSDGQLFVCCLLCLGSACWRCLPDLVLFGGSELK